MPWLSHQLTSSPSWVLLSFIINHSLGLFNHFYCSSPNSHPFVSIFIAERVQNYTHYSRLGLIRILQRGLIIDLGDSSPPWQCMKWWWRLFFFFFHLVRLQTHFQPAQKQSLSGGLCLDFFLVFPVPSTAIIRAQRSLSLPTLLHERANAESKLLAPKTE